MLFIITLFVHIDLRKKSYISFPWGWSIVKNLPERTYGCSPRVTRKQAEPQEQTEMETKKKTLCIDPQSDKPFSVLLQSCSCVCTKLGALLDLLYSIIKSHRKEKIYKCAVLLKNSLKSNILQVKHLIDGSISLQMSVVPEKSCCLVKVRWGTCG